MANRGGLAENTLYFLHLHPSGTTSGAVSFPQIRTLLYHLLCVEGTRRRGGGRFWVHHRCRQRVVRCQSQHRFFVRVLPSHCRSLCTGMRRLRRVWSTERLAFAPEPLFGIQWAEHEQYVKCLLRYAPATTKLESRDHIRPRLLEVVDENRKLR